MRWLSYYKNDSIHPGILTRDGKGVIDLNAEWNVDSPSWGQILRDRKFDEIMIRHCEEGWKNKPIPLGDISLGPPVPDPSKVIAVGLNYRDHAEEQGKTPPEKPLLFAKAPSCLIGDGAPIVIPADESKPDAEAELAFVVAKTARDVSANDAYEYIAGITIMNDVSGREAQYGDRQWFRGKSYDTFGPAGPWVVTLDEIKNPQNLELRCLVDGEPRQNGNTSDMIFGICDLMHYISRQMTLCPGDIVSTGTPAGVGVFRDPPLFINSGDLIEIELESVGKLTNRVE